MEENYETHKDWDDSVKNWDEGGFKTTLPSYKSETLYLNLENGWL